jgi:integrase
LLTRGKWYYVRFRVGGERIERALKLSNKVRAQRRAAKVDAALEKGEPWEWVVGRTAAGDRSFTEVVDEWLEKGCRWSENTRRGHAAIVRQLKEEFGRRLVTEIRPQDIEGYLARRRDGGMPPSSRNRILAVLKSIFKKIGPPPDGWGYVPANPAASVRMEKEDIKTKDVLDDDEVERLLAVLPETDRRVVLVAAETGMRRSELERLLWEDVDLSAGELYVKVAKNRTFRTVPLTGRPAAVLADMKAEATPHPKAPVFQNVTSNQTLRGALERAGIEKAVTLHTFRHLFATRALEAGVSSFHLQAIGGWKTPVMLERYGKRRNAALHAEMEKLDRSSGT